MYINGLKYACSTCIKGHRSSHCNHVDRPLFEIRKKGRPVTQCTYCRDLRKTKQIHIKCTCNDKKADSQQQPQQSLLRTQHQGSHVTLNDICQDKIDISDTNSQPLSQKKCTCTIPKPISLARSSSTGPSFSNPQPDSSLTSAVTRDNKSLMSPLCATTLPKMTENDQSYSWVLITSAIANHNPNYDSSSSTYSNIPTEEDITNRNMHSGLTFNKSPPSSHRFLDGQPRVHKRRSISHKRPIKSFPAHINHSLDSPMPTVNTFNDYPLSTPPSSDVSPHPTMEPIDMDMQFDYLGDELPILPTHNNQENENHFLDHLPNTEELAIILNNVLQKDQPTSNNDNMNQLMLNTHNTMNLSDTHHHDKNNNISDIYTSSSPSSSSIPSNSHCGSYAPQMNCCNTLGSSTGESVVITITPLVTSVNGTMQMEERRNNYPMTTRIVTCHCGIQCSCPGCLVHSNKFNMDTDPQMSLNSANTMSSASSSCYGSDEEEIAFILNRNMFPNIQ
ncbi:hypothetical protein BDB01DRAFT_847299 [Pilobolus umbonatus]|nr:hypothetical protein BDB01DRAFT_847299 [Pilobolus umbonatus]